MASVTIDLPDERAAALQANATAEGLTLEVGYARCLIAMADSHKIT